MFYLLGVKTMRQRGQLIFYGLFIFSMIMSIVFVYQNHNLYSRPIAQIISANQEDSKQVTDEYGNTDEKYTQSLTAELKNGKHAGKQIDLTNEYSFSGAYDNAFTSGDEVFVKLDENKSDSGDFAGDITGVKRDKYVMIMAWVFTLALVLVGKMQGLFTTVSLAFNIILLSFALDLYVKLGMNLIWISILLVILFTIVSLLLVNGWNEKSFAAIIATLLGTFVSVGVVYVVMLLTSEEGLLYEEMQFLTRPYTLVFLGGLLIGSLGAVMDVAISISAALFELYETNKQISMKALTASGYDIGKDIMGTMTNILLFAYISGSIPILIVYFNNHSPLGFSLSINLSLEIARALAGGIGIVLTIPIGLYVTIFFIQRKKAKQ